MAKFQKGISGNKKGRPKKNLDGQADIKTLLHSYAPALIKKTVSLALKGDLTALKLCLDRVVPKVEPVSGLPPLAPLDILQSPNVEITKRCSDVLNGVLAGQISGKQAQELLNALITTSETLTDRRDRFGTKIKTPEEMINYFTQLIRTYANTEKLNEIISLLQSEIANPKSRSNALDLASSTNSERILNNVQQSVIPTTPSTPYNHSHAFHQLEQLAASPL